MQTSKRFRFVDDYEVITVEGKNGKKKKQTRYIGKWVCILDDAAQHRRKVLETRIAVLAAVIGVALAVCLNHAASRVMYVMLPTVIALFPTVYLLTGLLDLSSSTNPMEQRKYEQGIQRIKRSAMGIAVILCISLAAYLMYWTLPAKAEGGRLAFSLADIGYLIGTAAAIGSGIFCFRHMRSVAIELRENSLYSTNKNA